MRVALTEKSIFVTVADEKEKEKEKEKKGRGI